MDCVVAPQQHSLTHGRTPVRRTPGPNASALGSATNSGAATLLVCATTALLWGCVPQSVRVESVRDPESAAAQVIRLEPGPPPVIDNHLLFPMRSARKPSDAGEADLLTVRPALRIDERVAKAADVWTRIRAGLELSRTAGRTRIRREIDWYRRNQEYLDRMTERARRYLPFIVTQVQRRGIPLEIALLPVVESAFQPFAYSPMRASGIWQFIPSTGRLYGLEQNWWYDARRDIAEATRAALDYLQKLHTEFGGDWLLAVAAYNSGEGNVHKALRRNRRAGKALDFWSLKLPRETRTYVPRLLAVAEIVSQPSRYGLRLNPIADRPYFAEVRLDTQVDLALAAEVAGITLDEIYLLNPGFNRWATAPQGPHRLQLPVEAAAGFKQKLAAVAPERRIKWTRHTVARGETLGGIASRYHTSTAALRQFNGLRGNRIRAGRSLMVPVSMRSPGDYKLSAAVRQALRRVAPGSGRKFTHRVRNGENLWLIARRYRVSVKRLAAWNGIATNGILRVGKKLTVWRKGASAGDAAPDRRRTPPASEHYLVRRGDTLSEIGRRHRIPVRRITALNGISKHGILRPGQKLRIRAAAPKTSELKQVSVSGAETNSGLQRIRYTVRRGDSLWHISRRFKVSVASLREWNQLPNGRLLQPGQQLNVYIGASRNTEI